MESADVSANEEKLEPGVRIELENLNTCTDEINRLEVALDDANATFRHILSESTQHLRYLATKLGSCIERARPYYKAKDASRKAQMECQKAAVQFHHANEIYQAAEETISMAEERFLSRKGNWEINSAWQDMLNRATRKKLEAEKRRVSSEQKHHETALLFTQAERKTQQLERRLQRHIVKSKAYFEYKESLEQQLQQQKQKIQHLQLEVAVAKQKYADSLQNLECISARIHARREFVLEECATPKPVKFDSGDRPTNQYLEATEGQRLLPSPAISRTVSSDVEEEDESFDGGRADEEKTDWSLLQASIQNLTLQMASERGLTQEEIDSRIQKCIQRHGEDGNDDPTAADSATDSTAADEIQVSLPGDDNAETKDTVGNSKLM
ncbi:unnamed protein product [Darwinula stevensoni]|uniref:SH3 domain-binding protein 5-like protein n=1 Tax=Darwinula stevensoni TaxID=69355 RepID=A0A7R8XC45_9CRUS|nr:unnamed protein product [Darwinula stevensoni]CAG0893421.1 unnamed protein product [Darwinula stevensoni]